MSERGAFIFDGNLNDPFGGRERSTLNVFRDFYTDGSDLLVIGQHPLPDDIKHDELLIGTHSLGQREVPTFASLRNMKRSLREQDPGHIVFDTPTLEDLLILQLGIPHEMRDRTVALWRNTIVPKIAHVEGNSLRARAKQMRWDVWMKARVQMSKRVGINMCFSPHQKNELEELGVDPESIAIVPEQVGWEFSPDLRKTNKESHRRKFLDDDELGLLVSSRIHTGKGLRWIPPLYGTLRSERRFLSPSADFRKVKITLVGDAHDFKGKAYLDKLLRDIEVQKGATANHHAADAVSFNYGGVLLPDEMEEHLNAYDVLVAPSPEEGYGRVTVEAMTAGMTVIGNRNCPATTHILSEPPYTVGNLADSPQQMALQTMRLMTDGEELEERQYKALQWSLGQYTLEKARTRFFNALDKV